jgi:uncharacterized membrane protein YeiB
MWLTMSVLADGKFILIFARLLGASIVMLPGRASDRAIRAWRTHVHGMAALLVLGLLHWHTTSFCILRCGKVIPAFGLS